MDRLRATATDIAPGRTAATRRHTGLSGGPQALLALQSSAGNSAVAAVVQRLQAGAEPPRPILANPAADPRFVALRGEVRAKAGTARSHPRPNAEADKAKAAAVPPPNHKEAQAQAAQADVMAGAKPGGFDKAGFIVAVKAAIAAQAPKNLEEAEDFGSSGRAEAVKGQVAGRVSDGKQRSVQDIAAKTAAAPDPAAAKDKTVTPLAPQSSVALASVRAASGMPAEAPAEQTDFSGGMQQTDQQLAEADVSEEQLATSNEPELTGAVEAKKEGEAHSATAPGQVRESEAATLAAARQGAVGESRTGLLGIVGAKAAALTKSTSGKVTAKSKDETARAKVAAGVKSIFERTKTGVGAILDAVDKDVATRFDNGERTIREDFTRQHKTEMARYKDERYGGWDGAALWLADKVTSLPKEADQIFVRAKARYEERMSGLIGSIADFIGQQLTAAKDKIAAGRKEIKAFVDGQPKELQRVGAEAAEKFESQFDQLEGDVDSKQDSLVQDLASKYVEARGAVDEEIVAAQEENKGLWDKAKEAIGGAIKTILKLKDMLLGVLARAAGAIGKIIKDPIGFLGNFVNAVKGGILGFASRIEEHLAAGLKGWLLGALAEGGITLPEKWDLKGVVQLILSVLGLTWETIKGRIAQKIPPKVLDKVIQGFGIVKVLLAEGVGGLWTWVLARVGDIKEMVMTQIQEMVATEILKAGITWLISLLNPASAFIKACKMIYDVVMFFVEKADQIKEFVDSVLESVESIAGGGVGAVAGHIEKTLAKMVPVLIGFLASLLGLGGISGKIQKILATVQKPVLKVVDWVVGKAVAFGKKAWAGMKRLGGKIKTKGKALWGNAKKKLGIKEKTPKQIEDEKKARLNKGVAAGIRAVNRFAGKAVVGKLLRPLLAAVRLRYRMTLLEPVKQGERWAVRGVVNPESTGLSDVPFASVDPQRVRELAKTAESGHGSALNELAARRQQVLSKVGINGKPSDSRVEKAHNLTVAVSGSVVRQQGGGSRREAVADPKAAQNYVEAEQTRTKILADVQKEAYLNDPSSTPLSLGAMMRDSKLMAEVRARMAARGVYVPKGGRADRGRVGATSAIHAEKMVRAISGADAIGVSREMCEDCQSYFTSLGRNGALVVVADGTAVRVFTPEGQRSLADFV